MESGTAVTPEMPRFVQVDADRAYLVRVVRTQEDEYFPAIYTRRTNQVRDVFQNVRVNLAALAVERVWLVRCDYPTCKAGIIQLIGDGQGCSPEDWCPKCAPAGPGSPERGWVVEACNECDGEKHIHEVYRGTDNVCPECHGTGQHVERMGLVEALDRGRNGVGWHLSESSRTELARQGGEERYGLAIDALALLTEGTEQ